MAGGVPGVVLARATTHGYLGVARSRAARRAEDLDQIRPGLGGQQAITLLSRESPRFRTAGGDHYRRLDARSIVEPCVLDLEMRAGVGGGPTLPSMQHSGDTTYSLALLLRCPSRW